MRFIRDFGTAILAYFKGVALIHRLRLWGMFLIPALISLLVAACIGLGLYFLIPFFGAWLSTFWTFDFFNQGAYWLATSFSTIFFIVFAVLLYKHLVLLLTFPFMGKIVLLIEKEILPDSEQSEALLSFSGSLVASLRLTLRNLTRELFFSIPLILLSIIPVIGVFFSILLFLLQAYYMGCGNMDLVMERHLTYKERLRFIKDNRVLVLGNGIVCLFMLLPIVGIFFVVPLAITAASVVSIKKLAFFKLK